MHKTRETKDRPNRKRSISFGVKDSLCAFKIRTHLGIFTPARKKKNSMQPVRGAIDIPSTKRFTRNRFLVLPL